jgi:proline iminopeptidase
MKKLFMVLPLVFLLCFTFSCQQGEEVSTEETKEEVTSGTVNVDDFEFTYSIEGTGIPCMVVGSHIFWPQTFSSELRKHLKLIFVDSRFFTPIDKKIELSTFSMEIVIDDIEQVRNTLDLEKMAVLGHSAMGLFALEYGKKYPEHTSHVIMIGTPPNWNEEYQKLVNEFWESDASDERKAIYKRNMEELTEEKLNKVPPFRQWALQYIASSPWYWYDPNYDCSWLWEGLDGNMNIINHFFDVLLSEYDSLQDLGQLKAPVFLALGRYDYAVPYHSWDNVKDKFNNLSYNVFEKSGHYPMLEEWELFDKKLIDWIKSH